MPSASSSTDVGGSGESEYSATGSTTTTNHSAPESTLMADTWLTGPAVDAQFLIV